MATFPPTAKVEPPVPTAREPGRVEVRIAPELWAQEVERLRPGSPARAAAERERRRLETDGLPRGQLIKCDSVGADGTKLPGLFKAYVPISAGPASQRPFGFVFSPGQEDGRTHLTLVAFGERHPAHGTRAVYQRAHKRLHGRYPDEERSGPGALGRSPQTRAPGRAVRPPAERGGFER